MARNERFDNLLKISDVYRKDSTYSSQGRVHKANIHIRPEAKYLKWRPGFTGDIISPEHTVSILDEYQLKSLEFGNWVPQSERVNWLMGMQVAFADLETHVLKFKNTRICMGELGLAFGARGTSSAAAHYEPGNNVINLTRQRGMYAFAHEYAHYLDYVVGGRVERIKDSYALTGGRTWRKPWEQHNGPIRSAALAIVFRNRYKDGKVAPARNGRPTTKMWEAVKEMDYWQRPTEIFARSFEVYVSGLMNRKGFKNAFLAAHKYDNDVWQGMYPDDSDRADLNRLWDKFFSELRKKL